MMKRRSGYMLVILIVFVSLLLTNGLPFFQSNSLSVMQNRPTIADNKTFVLNDKEERIMKEVGQVPYITDVLFDETKDGKLIISATAEIGSSDEPNKKRLAREIAHKYTVAVYSADVQVVEASIHITADNHLILGASLGSDHQKKMTQSTITGSGVAEFFQFLKQNEMQSTEPEKNTWVYEIP